jgi:pimeloyl-ACP methyl ester carboxylesterase
LSAVDDSDSLISSNLVFSDDRKYQIIRDSMVREIFYGDCSDADVARAKSLLVREPAVPIETPLRLTQENYSRVPREYIGCCRDKAVSPALQKMYTAIPCENVILMDTSHSPFFSKPEELAAHLTATLRSV